ncbi:hypothetical protein T4B_15323 [Trichinella pseudospiralis]|uniref:Uncharacterized protein n=1 Tax=Trichinella pseudospiralis TaxID=6337 RepID=A0A0V1JBK2_TRIPS|nr:hypothetical protein T4B_15323 [Trichinella pseudospiralis]
MEAKLHQSTVNSNCESPATEINVVAIRSVDREDTIVSKSIKVPMSHAPVDRSTNTKEKILLYYKLVTLSTYIVIHGLVVSLCKVIPEVRAP